MKLLAQQFRSVPVGIVPSIINTISLVAEIVSCKYSDVTHIEEFNLYKEEIQDEAEKVDILIKYNIEDDMYYSFEVFIKQYVTEAVERYLLLNKCWELNIND